MRLSNARRQFLLFLGGRVFAAFLQAVGFVVLGRMISVSSLGSVGVAWSLCSVSAIIFDAGMSSHISRAEARGEQSAVSKALRLNLRMMAAYGAILTATFAILSICRILPLGLLPIGFAASLDQRVETRLSVAVARGIPLLPLASIVLRRFSTVVLLIVLAALGVPALVSYSVAYSCGGLLGLAHLRRALPIPPPSGAAAIAKVGLGRHFLLSNVTAQVRSLDVVLLALFSPTAQVGIYTAATRFTNPLLLVPATLSAVMLPAASRSSRDATKLLARNLCIGFCLMIVPLVSLTLAGGPAVSALLGARYVTAAELLPLTYAALPLIALSSPLGTLLQAQGFEQLVAKNGTVFAGLVLAAMAVGAATFGAVGVAASLLVTYGLKCVSLMVLINVHLGQSGDAGQPGS